MVVLLVLVAALWVAALVVLVVANDNSAHVAVALASKENIINEETDGCPRELVERRSPIAA